MEDSMSRETGSPLSRRKFAALAAGCGATANLIAQDVRQNISNTPAPEDRRRGPRPDIAPFSETLAFSRRLVEDKVRAFPMNAVRLTAGIFKDAEESNRAVLHRLTGDQESKAKGDQIVAELAQCQEKLGGGYLSAFPSEFLDRLKVRKKVWAPFYTYHKIMAGMLDMNWHCGNRQALEVVQGMAQWTDNWSAPNSEAQMQDILNIEYGGMNEVLYNLAAVTGNDRYAAVGDRFTKKRFFNPLGLRRDELRGLHVNTHIPQLIGAARRYELTGDERFHDVADFFWYEVTSARAYVTGGTSNGEGWRTEP